MARITSSVTSVSWIPSEAIEGLPKLPFEMGLTHYDEPPPDSLEDVKALPPERFRLLNELRAWIDVENDRIVGYGQGGGGRIGKTRVSLIGRDLLFHAVPLPDRRPDPAVFGDRVRFVQTSGGRTSLPAPRRVSRKPFVQLTPPVAWTTLALTLHADGRSKLEVPGASSFPRHWIYDDKGNLVQKTGLVDFQTWYQGAFGTKTPWGDEDSPAVVTAAETALEREVSRSVMRQGSALGRRDVDAGETLVQQGTPGDALFLVLDGVLSVEVDGEPIAEVGPGALLGERALLEGGHRTATLRAATNCRVAVITEEKVDKAALLQISLGHRRESDGGSLP